MHLRDSWFLPAGLVACLVSTLVGAGELVVEPDPAPFANAGLVGAFEFEGVLPTLPLGAEVLAGVVAPDDLLLAFRVRSLGMVAIDGVGIASGELPAPGAAGRIPGGGIPVLSAALADLPGLGPTAVFDLLGSLAVGSSETIFVALPAASLGSPPLGFTLLASSDLSPPVAFAASVEVQLLERLLAGPDRQTLDDFESGPFSLSVMNDAVQQSQSELPAASVFGGRREIYLSTLFGGGSADAVLAETAGDDGVGFSAIGEATLALRYGPFEPPVDLTAGDTIDRFVVEGVRFDAPGRVNVSVLTADGGFGIGSPAPEQGVVTYGFDRFPGDADFTRVEEIELQVILQESGNAAFTSFRAVPEPAAGLLTACALAAVGLRSQAFRRGGSPRSPSTRAARRRLPGARGVP